MSANPISWMEIEAFAHGADIEITPWERSVIRQLDRAVLAISEKKSQTKTKGEPQAKMEVEASDGAGVASLLRGFRKGRKE